MYEHVSTCDNETPSKRTCHNSIVEHDVTIKLRFEKLENGSISVSHDDIVVDGILFGLIQKGYVVNGKDYFSIDLLILSKMKGLIIN